MKHIRINIKRISTTLLLLLMVLIYAKAQTVVEIVNDSDNSVVFRIENIDPEETPQKIVLVYDSNLITLESTSMKTQFVQSRELHSDANYSQSSSASLLATSLAVEFENEMAIENWMMEPFKYTTTRHDSEPEMKLEQWMYDLNSWKN